MRRSDASAAAIFAVVAALAPATAGAEAGAEPVCGVASWYGPGFGGRATASGEAFDPTAFTAAHREWPFGALVRVTLSDGAREESVVVRINDRGPVSRDRLIDLSQAAAERLGMIEAGLARVCLVIVETAAD